MPLKHRMIFEGPGAHMLWLTGLWRFLIVALLVAGAVYIARTFANRPAGSAPARGAGTTPLQILEERFARGEIDEEEFRSRRETLRS